MGIKWITITVSVLMVGVWATTLAWFVFAALAWLGTEETTVVHQCYGAARCGASLMFGYVTAKALSSAAEHVVRVARMWNKNDMSNAWITTFTGRQFWPLDPNPDDIVIEDIVHALSNMCRFNGHCREFYSVAMHSINVCQQFLPDDPRMAMEALMHDATEAYLGDICGPVKRALDAEKHEQVIRLAVAKRFGLEPEVPKAVEVMDYRMFLSEVRDLMPTTLHSKVQIDRACAPTVYPDLNPLVTKSTFLKHWEMLTTRLKTT